MTFPMIPEPFTPIVLGGSIVANLATDILKDYANDLEGTLMGRVLKSVGLIPPNLYEHLYKLLCQTLDQYFDRFPERDLLGLDSFFLDVEVASQIGAFLLERKAIDWPKVEQSYRRHVSPYAATIQKLQSQNVSPNKLIQDFIDCYKDVLRQQLTLPEMVVLLELSSQADGVIAEIRASEQRMQQFITDFVQNQLSPQNQIVAYEQGQRDLAERLINEVRVAGVLPGQNVPDSRTWMKNPPALFTSGLCQGRLLKPHDNYFVAHGLTPDLLADWRQVLEEVAITLGGQQKLQPYFAGDQLEAGYRFCGICERLYTSRFSMFLLPALADPNVYLELGIAIGLGVPFFLIQHYEAKVPPILAGLSRYANGGLFRTMRRELAGQIEEYDFGVVRFKANLPSAGSLPEYLIAAGQLVEDEDFEGSVQDALSSYASIQAVSLQENLVGNASTGWALDTLVKKIQAARFGVYRVDETCSPTTFLALGISIGLDRPFLMVHRANHEVPLDLRGMGIYQFANFVGLQGEIVPRHQEFLDRHAR
jgi:hypothetical protein